MPGRDHVVEHEDGPPEGAVPAAKGPADVPGALLRAEIGLRRAVQRPGKELDHRNSEALAHDPGDTLRLVEAALAEAPPRQRDRHERVGIAREARRGEASGQDLAERRRRMRIAAELELQHEIAHDAGVAARGARGEAGERIGRNESVRERHLAGAAFAEAVLRRRLETGRTGSRIKEPDERPRKLAHETEDARSLLRILMWVDAAFGFPSLFPVSCRARSRLLAVGRSLPPFRRQSRRARPDNPIGDAMTSSNPSRVGVAILALLASTLPAFAQTAGDLALIGWNDATDAFTLVTLADIPSGTTFYFTDNGWTGTAFRGVTATNNGGSEGVCRLVTNATIPMGTLISNTSTGPSFTWTFSGPISGGGNYSALALSNADQIYIFTNTATTDPVFNTASMTHIFLLDDTGAFENAAGQFTGNITPGLTLGSTAITFNQFAETANFMGSTPSLPHVQRRLEGAMAGGNRERSQLDVRDDRDAALRHVQRRR